MVDSPAPGVSRRSLLRAGATGLAVGATGVLVSACDAVDDAVDQGPDQPPELAPDVAVATAALAEISALRAAVEGTVARFPDTRRQLEELVAMHRAHEEAVADAVPARARTSSAPAPFVVARKREAALRKLAAREQRLHDTLGGLALRAQSGDFARLLAAMGAGITQRLAVWQS